MSKKNKFFADDGWAFWVDGDDTSTIYLNSWLNPKGKSYMDVENKAKVIGYMRLLRRCLRRDGDETTVNHYRKNLIGVLDKVDTLVF